MSTKAKRHIHKYRKIRIANAVVWSCGLKDCNHYMPKHMEETIPGKGSICWDCEKEIILNDTNMDLSLPLCSRCRRIAEGIPVEPLVEEPQKLPDESLFSTIKPKPTAEIMCKKCKNKPVAAGNIFGHCVTCAILLTMK